MDIFLRGKKSKLIRAVNRINNRGFPYKDEFQIHQRDINCIYEKLPYRISR